MKNKSIKIAIEAFTLSEPMVTGVGKVAFNYLNELQKLNSDNLYIIYTRDELLHFKIYNKNWANITFNNKLKDIRVIIKNKWIKHKESKTNKTGNIYKIKLLLLRLLKIFFEILDRRYFTILLKRSLKQTKADIYIGFSTIYSPNLKNLKIRKLSFLYDLVWIFFPQTMEFGNKWTMKFTTKRNLSMTDLIISISRNTQIDAQKLLNIRTPIITIPLAADKNIFFQASKQNIVKIKRKYNIDKKYILSVCTLEPRKNLESLIKAFITLKNASKFQLVLVGKFGWIDASFFNLIKSKDLQDNCIITDYIPDEDLAPLYSGAEVFVFPSLYEGFGLPVLEAMQCGCPVIASNTSSLPEIISDCGILIDPLNISQLSDSLHNVLMDKNLRENLIQKGLEKAKLFSWGKSAELLLEEIKE